jgi:uncharacterized protein
MILIGDSSALIALAVCDSLDVLSELYREVYVPEAVFFEVTKSDKPEAHKLRQFLSNRIKSVHASAFVYLDALADKGETDAMLLYKQLSADRLLIDDKKGRKIAQLNHIRTIGSLGVLLKAFRAGLLPDIDSVVEKLKNSRVFISPELLKTFMEVAQSG